MSGEKSFWIDGQEIPFSEGQTIMDAALAAGEGAIQVDGRMVDVPVADRARKVVAMRDRIAARSL